LVAVGKRVTYVDSVGQPHDALVTAVWGEPEQNPAINVVVVNLDEGQRDTYGQKIERFTSVVHKTNQSAHGFYWTE